MAKVHETVTLNATPQEVWGCIGGFDSIARWHPAIDDCVVEQQGNETLRQLSLGDDIRITERLDESDATARSYTCTIIDAGPLPIKNYQSTLSATGSSVETTVTWTGKFEPADGATEAQAVEAVTGMYTGGFAALVEKYGSG